MSNLTFISPFFIVEHLQQSVTFYVDKLGFELRYTGPAEDPFWAIVGRGKISIMLKAIAPDIKPVPNHTRHEWARWDAYISVEDPDSLFEEYRAGGVSFHQPLKNDGDGLRGFEVKDADDYMLFFGRPVSSHPPPVPIFKKMSPQLLVTHIEHSIEFYTNKLGFSLDFRYEDFYAGIIRDGHSIHLKCSAPPQSAAPEPATPQSAAPEPAAPQPAAPPPNDAKNKDDLDIMFSVGDIELFYEYLLSQSVEIVQPLRDMPYGREFYIADPDGNRIAFIEES
jgi:catechol 2,3-dioxygenase-like lactoylglutathione lyase family enzyme